jgi:hypothetical protein
MARIIQKFKLRKEDLSVVIVILADTVNSFGFHPSLPLAASASGHRRFKLSAEFEDVEDFGSYTTSCSKGQCSN